MKKIGLFLLLFLFCYLLSAEEVRVEKGDEMLPRIEQRDQFLLIGVEIENALEGNKMTEIWTKFFQVNDMIPNCIRDNYYGVSFQGKSYDPGTGKGLTYFIGREVSTLDKVPEGMVAHTIPKSLYAVFEHKGDISLIGNTYGYIFGRWMIAGNYRPAMHYSFEQYDERFKHGSEDSIIEIWIPVEAKK